MGALSPALIAVGCVVVPLSVRGIDEPGKAAGNEFVERIFSRCALTAGAGELGSGLECWRGMVIIVSGCPCAMLSDGLTSDSRASGCAYRTGVCFEAAGRGMLENTKGVWGRVGIGRWPRRQGYP